MTDEQSNEINQLNTNLQYLYSEKRKLDALRNRVKDAGQNRTLDELDKKVDNLIEQTQQKIDAIRYPAGGILDYYKQKYEQNYTTSSLMDRNSSVVKAKRQMQAGKQKMMKAAEQMRKTGGRFQNRMLTLKQVEFDKLKDETKKVLSEIKKREPQWKFAVKDKIIRITMPIAVQIMNPSLTFLKKYATNTTIIPLPYNKWARSFCDQTGNNSIINKVLNAIFNSTDYVVEVFIAEDNLIKSENDRIAKSGNRQHNTQDKSGQLQSEET
jgi:hypothetical protein